MDELTQQQKWDLEYDAGWDRAIEDCDMGGALLHWYKRSYLPVPHRVYRAFPRFEGLVTIIKAATKQGCPYADASSFAWAWLRAERGYVDSIALQNYDDGFFVDMVTVPIDKDGWRRFVVSNHPHKSRRFWRYSFNWRSKDA